MTINDPFWQAVVDFLIEQRALPNKIVAPQEFAPYLSGIVSYDSKELVPLRKIDWVVVHKGLVDELGKCWLQEVINELHPVFANEVFVIFSKSQRNNKIMKSNHVKAFFERFKSLTNLGLNYVVGGGTRMTIYIGNNRALTRTVHGHKMYVDTRDVIHAPHLLLDGYWENWITQFFLNIVKPGMNVVDIGANIGYYSLLAAKQMGPHGKLYSFEANPDIATLLLYNLEINGYLDRAAMLNKAVYSKSTQLDFYINEQHIAASSIWHNEGPTQPFQDTFKKITVNAVSLDEFFPIGTKIDVIKMDAEGAEPLVLRGARRLLDENPKIKIILEFNPYMLRASLQSANAHREFFEWIHGIGFRIYIIEHDSTLTPASFDRLESQVIDVLLER